MATKKSANGEGMGPSPKSTKPRTATTPKRVRAASRESGKSQDAVKKGSTKTTPGIPEREPLHEEIAKRAYELFERRGLNHGQDLNDWLEAEQEILHRPSRVAS